MFTINKPRRAKGREFKPREPYTHRLRKILEEYPDGSQVLREILQNSDDAKSTEQIFILDRNTYSTNSLFEPDLVNNYHRTDLKLDRFQGPALLAKNNTIFKERDFQSLLKLADSEKRDQFDKIGVMGVGFNSIYHITDSPSFITGDKYVILDPHEWYFNGGVQFDFVDENLAEEYPDQFVPFGIPCDKQYEGTIFRYPLRTSEDSIDSDISNKIYKAEEILDMFQKFYENESINCLLFLKYIERISFYELKEGATKPELLYMVQLENSNKVRKQRRLIVENIVPMMDLLKSKKLGKNIKLHSSYVASLSRQKGDCNETKETSPWLILNYLDDLNEAEAYFQKMFLKSIGDYKFVPNVGLAISLKNLNAIGRLFCFLPLPISMPFNVSVHGYFAVSTNRRSLWSVADNEDLATDALARLKVTWNRYLFENVLPKAWVEFLRVLPLEVTNIRREDLYKFWPIIKDSTSGVISNFCKDLLQNVMNCLNIEDHVFRGPSSSNNTIGILSKVSAESYRASSFKESEFYWLSLSNGYLEDPKSFAFDISKIIEDIGFPVISAHPEIIKILKNSRHKDALSFFSPAVVRTYLDRNRTRWENSIPRSEVLQLFYYILKDKNFDELVGFKIIPLADGTLGTITTATQSNDSCVYIGPDEDNAEHDNDERNIFKSQLNKFIDKSIDFGLYRCLYDNAKAGWNLNIKILDEFVVADMIKLSLDNSINEGGRNLRSLIGNIGKKIKSFIASEEIPISNRREWIYQLWKNLRYRNWDLTKFEDINLIPTNHSTLRKLNTPKRIFSSQMSKNLSIESLIPIFEKFGAVFVENEFDLGEISKWNKLSSYIIKPDDIVSVLNSFRADSSYPGNLNHTLQDHEASALAEHLSNYLRLADKSYHILYEIVGVIKHLPIFIKIDHTSPISLLPGNKEWHLLPREEENSYGKIIYPSNKGGFLCTRSQNLCYILEEIIQIPRLTVNNYWQYYVIPFLESQSPKDIDTVIDKLFDRLQSLLDNNANLKNILGKIPFVPGGTLKMSQQQETPTIVKLFKPMELFDPEEKTIVDLFFDDDQVFPAGKYGIPQASSSRKFLSSLKLLGIKSILSPNDIIARINYIVSRRQNPDAQDQALKLFKYIDENWNNYNMVTRGPNNNNGFLKAVLEKEWVPSIYALERLIFSKPKNCYGRKDKDLICFVSPVIEIDVNNEKFLRILGWNTYPETGKVLKQLEFCCKGVLNKQPPKNLKTICTAIYRYIDEAFKSKSSDRKSKEEFFQIKAFLKDKPWILCGDKFYPAEKVVITLPAKFQTKESLIVELPNHISNFKPLFKAMGVRDEIGVKDLITIIKNMVKGNKDEVLSTNEINNVIRILEQIAKIQKENKREGNEMERLDGLLIPSNESMLFGLHEIHFDDMNDRLDEEVRSKHKIAHSLITLDIARELEIQTLTGKIYGNNYTGDIDWKTYEQNESLTTRIKNIIKDYSIGSLFKEFLQNADDAKATRFLVIVDERQIIPDQKSLLSEEMKDWQGPAIWIYNDAEFSAKDFQSLIKLGVGGKSHDDTKIGRFGIGFNCAFHVTDLPSFVSGKYIAFLDPNAKYLPVQGYPPRRPRGTRIDFIDKEFKKSFPDQCVPYEALGCDFSKEFKGTLFRLPLRTLNLARQSEITNKVVEIKDILQLFDRVEGNKEMLFLRNIESCGLYHLKERMPQSPQLIWKAQINMSDTCRNIRKSITDKIQMYQLDIEIEITPKKKSEIWLLCTGGHEKIKQGYKELRTIIKEKRLKPRGGVASLLAQSDKKSLDELRDETYPNPPELKGEIFSYLSLSMISYLGVHLNGNFSLSSARSSVLQSEDFLQADCDDAKWNRYILLEVLPELHIKLLEEIVKLENIRYEKDRSNFVPHITNNLWPINKNLTMKMYKFYGSNVIKKLSFDEYKIFWTEANDGKFVSLSDAKVLAEEDTIIADILVNLQVPVPVVKLDKYKIDQLNKIFEPTDPPKFPISGGTVCKELQARGVPVIYNNANVSNTDDKKHDHESLFRLLKFILKDKSSFENLAGLQLVPLSDGSVGTFGEVYYIGKQKHIDLFPNAGSSKFVTVSLPKDLQEIFIGDEFSALTNIKKFDASAILDLLTHELESVKEKSWDPNGKKIPNSSWLKKIWSKLNKANKDLEYDQLSKFPLLPVVKPSDMLIQPDMTDPLLYVSERGHTLYPVLVKLKVRFTSMVFPEDAHENLKKCVIPCTFTNIVNALKRACSSNLTMKELFETSNLLPSDYEKFRTYIKEQLENETVDNGSTQDDYLDTFNPLSPLSSIWPMRSSKGKLKSGYPHSHNKAIPKEIIDTLSLLPIWPVHSNEEKFIDAKSGRLLPHNLPFFSFNENTNFYRCYNCEKDFNALLRLGAIFINELEYIRSHIVPSLCTSETPKPTKDYITFLKSILSSGNEEIEQYLRQYQVKMIPNRSLTAFVKANTLYDTGVQLFRNTFAETDKFLPTELQRNPVCLEALVRVGLNREINCYAYIACAEEIASQIEQNRVPVHIARNRAKDLVRHLYENYDTDTLEFNLEQWNYALGIKFVPSEKNISGRIYQEPKETSGFESFESLCSHKYKNICWTQCPLFDGSVDPANFSAFNGYHPEIGMPSTENIINHWFFIVEKIKSSNWKSLDDCKDIKTAIKEIYGEMNKLSSKEKGQDIYIRLRINNPTKKIFLNDDYPFEEEHWVAGRDLIFGLQEDIKEGMYKVNDCLMAYKDLLLLGGARELVDFKSDRKIRKHDQKDTLIKALLNKFISSSDYHDVIFIVGEEKARIGANRYVLSASSTHFERMFCGGLIEASASKIEVPIKDVRPDTFQVMLRWLYGQTFEDAAKSILRKRDEFETDKECYETYYLSFLVNLLKVTDIYGVEKLKDELEDTIITGSYVSVCNVCEILLWSKECKAIQLKIYCKQFIELNKDLVLEQRLEYCANAANEQERLEESEMLELLLSDDD